MGFLAGSKKVSKKGQKSDKNGGAKKVSKMGSKTPRVFVGFCEIFEKKGGAGKSGFETPGV